MNSNQKVYLSFAILFSISGLILSLIYRPYVYEHNINDFGFADTIGSLVSVIAFCSLVWAFKPISNKEKNKHILYCILVYGFFWESLGLVGIYGTFDWKDICAVIISGIITFALKSIVDNSLFPMESVKKDTIDKSM